MPAYPNHQDIRPAYVQATDPGAVGAGVFWVDTSSGPPFQLNVRDLTDTGWDLIGSTGGAASTVPGPPGYDGDDGEDGISIPGATGPPGSGGAASQASVLKLVSFRG